ncbi:hypothetical protein ACE1B6_26405 [Aerosakkonemataceae cyanobacterium BLCC-F154]|uniref:Uncharacterized protein n=1 Tax=Floridaenema fluviatile BLCC-F154 TaxID=3153640 RepID=A0ABV4YIZ4_9CYAN
MAESIYLLLSTVLIRYIDELTKNEQEAIEQLKVMRVFDLGAIANFYLTTNAEYKKTKTYIRMLDYLRLLILEYLINLG